MGRGAKRILLATVAVCGLAGAVFAPVAAAATPQARVTYSTFAYISTERHGSAVYVNGLVKQNSAAGLIRSAGRTVYLQRNLNGGWQTMLSRVTNSTGQLSVGFVSVVSYPYRLVVIASSTAAAATSGTSTPPVLVTKFANCASANTYYPHGIGKAGAIDHTSGTPVTNFYASSALYQANTALDRDHDGIACEKL